MRRSWRIAAIALFSLALAAGGLFGDRLLALTDQTRDTLRLYTDLVKVAHDKYGGEVSYRDLVYASIQGMIRTLDPHTTFLVAEEYQGMREKQQTSYYGLGILVGVRNGQLTVIAPLEGTPGARLGIQPGDVISTIEGEPTETMSLDEAVGKLKGPKGTQVHIAIARRGMDKPIEMAVTRAEIPQTTVREAYMITPTTGYIQVTEFARGTGTEVAEAIDKLRAKGMTRLLVDLRNNGGGLLDPAIEVSEELLPEGSTIVETRGRTRDSFQTYKVNSRRTRFDLPLVMLVNEGTASASEIVSGAVQDHDRGLIVGTPSWGKGLVQTVYNLSYGTGLALTTAKYYTPSGRLIQRDYSSYFDYYTHADAGSPEITGKKVGDGQVFKTDLGRKVYGGGGITPDVVIADEKLSPSEQFLLARNAFANFAVDFSHRNPVKSMEWKPGPEVIQAFHDWVIHEKIATAEEVNDALLTQETRDYSVTEIRAEMLNIAFGQEARHRVLAQGDKQIGAALGEFDRAAALLSQRRELDRVAAQRAAAARSR
ncbi:MAG TPA: S41 family peptidase [Thermoanaerobaculia bacterium]|jgi:carboxyl-terminal processing protease|nr:S41 family peptidase [Thermoanaerobaculia bacterium]